MSKGKGGSSYRSAISGRYVTSGHGKANPRTTVKESGGKSGSTGGAYRTRSRVASSPPSTARPARTRRCARAKRGRIAPAMRFA